MKILLLWPPMTVFPPDPKVPSPSSPLGLAYIASVLEKHGYEVKILDALALGRKNIEKGKGYIKTGLADEEIKNFVEKFKPDIIGISSMFTAYVTDVHNCARIVKGTNPDVLVVVGGAHASVAPHTILKDRNIDIVVKGEGEVTFLEIVKSLENKKNMFEIPGTIVRKNDRPFYNPNRSYVRELDTLSFPARHLLPMDIYMKHNEIYGDYIMRHPQLDLITSRGCPARCIFCSIHSVWGHKWRGRSAKNVVDEIESLVNDYGVEEIAFLDDNLTLDKKRIIGICNEIIGRGLDIKWCTPNGVALWTLDKQVIKKMKESGCYRLTFGIESGSSETQKFIGKTIDLKRAKSLIRYANNIGLWTVSTFIIGFPNEDAKSIQATINYAVDCDTDFALFYILAPFPYTPVYEIFKKQGLINEKQKNWGYILGGGGCNTKFFTKEELKEWQRKAHLNFFKHRLIYDNVSNLPRLIKKVHCFEDLIYTKRIVKNALKILSRLLFSKFRDIKHAIYEKL